MGVRLIAHGGLAIHHETRGQCHVRLTLADRSEIENGLRSNRGVSAITRTQKKAGSTVIREILFHRVPSDKGAKGRVTDDAPTAASATGNTYARRKDRGIASRKGAALHNLTQRLPWTGRRWKKLTEWNARLCGKNARLFHLKVRLLLRRCVYFFKFQRGRG